MARPRTSTSRTASKHLKERQARHEDRRLADGRRVEGVSGPRTADGREVVSKEIGSAGEELGRRRMTVDPVPEHPHGLSTLAGKKDSDSRPTGRHGIATINGAGQRSFLDF
jgi:hypothetical protein